MKKAFTLFLSILLLTSLFTACKKDNAIENTSSDEMDTNEDSPSNTPNIDKSTPNYMLYLKDGELYYSNASGIKPMQVTDDLLSNTELKNQEISYTSYNISYLTQVCSNGNTIFFPDAFEYTAVNKETYSFDLYYRPTDNAENKAVKLDTDLSGYSISNNGKIVVYKKDNSLYAHDLENKTKIADDVAWYAVSNNGRNIFWNDTDGNLYVKKGNQEKQKLDSGVASILAINDKGDTIWYKKNYNEEAYTFDYYAYGLKGKKKIASDVSNIYCFNKDAGTFYYIKKNEGGTSLDNFLDNADQLDEYYLTEEVTNTTIHTYELFYYDGNNSDKLSDCFYEYLDYSYNSVMVFTELSGNVKISAELNDRAHSLKEKLAWAADYKVAVNAVVCDLDIEDVYDLQMTPEGDAIYYVTDVTEPQEGEEDYVPTGTVFKIDISNKTVAEAEKYADDIYAYSLYIRENDNVIYYKDYKYGREDGTSTPATFKLYINNKMVADDVNGILRYYADDATLLFCTEDEGGNYALNYWNGKKAVKVSDNVYDCEYTPDGEVLYLKDYSLEKYKGELHLFDGEKSTKVDDDVVAIVPVYSTY